MARALIGWKNQILTGALAASSALPALPASNLQSAICSPSTAWQTLPGITSATLLIDSGNPLTNWRAFILARTNLSSGALIQWRVGALAAVSGDQAGAYAFSSMTAANMIGFTAIDQTLMGPQNIPFTVATSAFYVAPSGGSDSNAGTQASPFATITKARDAMRASGTVKTTYLRGGLWTPGAQILLSPSDANTTYSRFPSEVPIVDGGGTVTDLFKLDPGANGITFFGLEVRNVLQSAIHLGGFSSGAVSGTIIRDCYIHGIGGSTGGYAGGSGGIYGTYWTQDNIIRNNRVTDCIGPCICFVAGTGTGEKNIGNQVLYNVVMRANNSALTDTGAIYFLDRLHNGTSSDQTQIKWNFIQDSGDAADVRGIYLDDQTSYVQVYGNIVCGSMSFAINIHGGDHCVVTNNIFDISKVRNFMGIYQDAPSGQTNYGMASNSFTGNIVYSSGPTAYPASQMWAYYFAVGNVIAKPTMTNNLFFRVGGTLPATAGDIPDTAPVVTDPLFAPAAPGTLAFNSGSVSAGIVPGFGQSVVVAPASVAGQYCLLTITDTANADGFLNIPGVFAGDAWQPATNVSPSTTQGRDDATTEVVTRGGQEYPVLYWRRRRWELDFQGIRSSEVWPYYDDLDNAARLNTNVLFIPDPASATINREAVFGRLKSRADLSYYQNAQDRRAWRATITERL